MDKLTSFRYTGKLSGLLPAARDHVKAHTPPRPVRTTQRHLLASLAYHTA